MAPFEWVDVSDTESDLMWELRMGSVFKRNEMEFQVKVIHDGRVVFEGITDSRGDGKSMVQEFLSGQINDENTERGEDGMTRRKRTTPVVVVEEEKKEKKKKRVSGVVFESATVERLMGIDPIIQERIDKNTAGGSPDLIGAVKAYIVDQDNTWSHIYTAILDLANKISRKVQFRAENSDGPGIVLKIHHNTEQKVKLFNVNEDQYIKNPIGFAMPLGQLVNDTPDVNVSGGWKFGNMIKADLPKFYGVVSKSSANRDKALVEACIDIKKEVVDISIDIPLSIMFGTLTLEKLKAIFQHIVDEHDVRFDVIAGMSKFLKKTLKTGEEKLLNESKELSNQITDYQNEIVSVVRSLRACEDNLDIMRSRKTPDKILEEFKPLLESKLIRDEIEFSTDGAFTVIYPDIRVKHRDYEYEFGDIAVKFYSSGTVKGVLDKCVRKLEPGQQSRTGEFITPHLKANGEFCLGNYTSVLADYLLRSELASTISLMGEFLKSYNEASPFTPIHRWKKDADFSAAERGR